MAAEDGLLEAHPVTLHARVADRDVDGQLHPLPVGARLGHVVRVAGVAPAEELRQDSGAALLGVLQRLEDEATGTLAHDEAVAVHVPGARRLCRLVVAAGERLRRVQQASDQQRERQKPEKTHPGRGAAAPPPSPDGRAEPREAPSFSPPRRTLAAMNPPMPQGMMLASLAPATITSACPARMWSAALRMAKLPLAQAEEMA